jgi:hypothetical protein
MNSFFRVAAFAALVIPPMGMAQERPISLDAPSGRTRLLGELEISGFAVGSASWNSALQMVPEFAGGAAALAAPRQVNFRFDKVGVALSKRFGPTLSVSAAFEVESHKDAHSHLRTNPATQCVNVPAPCESFGAETPATESTLDKLAITWFPMPALGLAFGRFDVPFGIERHDEVLNMTATTSEIYHFAKPQNFTGLQTFYQMGPLIDLNLWVANRWESHTTHEPFDDNNKSKSIGARLGLSPGMRDSLFNIGLGFWHGAERSDPTNTANLGLNGPKRTLFDVDATWSPSSRSAVIAEVVAGREEKVSFRARGWPVEAPAETDIDAKWAGGFIMAHQEVGRSLGLTARYGYLHDRSAWRTGIAQRLQSITLVSTIHLSALAGKAPLAVTYPRTQIRIHEMDLKIEYRYNRSNQPLFSDEVPPLADVDPRKHSHQVQLQAAINF